MKNNNMPLYMFLTVILFFVCFSCGRLSQLLDAIKRMDQRLDYIEYLQKSILQKTGPQEDKS